MPSLQQLLVGHEDVVAHQLHRGSPSVRVSGAQPSQSSSASPSSIDTTGKSADQADQVVHHLGGAAGFALELIGAVAVELAGGDVEGERHLGARLVARRR